MRLSGPYAAELSASKPKTESRPRVRVFHLAPSEELSGRQKAGPLRTSSSLHGGKNRNTARRSRNQNVRAVQIFRRLASDGSTFSALNPKKRNKRHKDPRRATEIRSFYFRPLSLLLSSEPSVLSVAFLGVSVLNSESAMQACFRNRR